ncbi:B12-binding domain-containing radical SAM protein [Magnetofaba australis]|uniref:Putative radical SAM protein n=1 Tax=Magnetofaba australis IT-1 TaxID=1434232 RepID=A0A1Y2K4R5_9PROT|nr:radical SAM protein [Magnetofaba australis]OSM03994.1 putative radical SAM protein [Magnetofaba australis IT-1]
MAQQSIERVLLTQPNSTWFGKRQWVVPPYTLGILTAVVEEAYEVEPLDPNLGNLTMEQAINRIVEFNPQFVGITCMSLEYAHSSHEYAKAVRRALPDAIICFGGVYATTSPELAMRDRVADFAVLGEGERRLPKLLEDLNAGRTDWSDFEGLTYWKDGEQLIQKPTVEIRPLDEVPFPNYHKTRMREYFQGNNSYGNVMNARREPYAITVTSRGCPYDCTYCSTHSIDGKKVRLRSAENVLEEIDILYNEWGIREILFIDDQLVINRKRFNAILDGLIERDYDLLWKSVNLATFLLTPELLEKMKASKTYQLILPIESGNQWVLDNILKKPLNLEHAYKIIEHGKKLGFEICSDFIIGSPGETWDQIRDSFRVAEEIDVDMVSFHIATPLPQTEMYHMAKDMGALPGDFSFADTSFFGFGKGSMETDEFTARDLHMLRALEWDRINFKSEEKRRRFAKIAGVSLEELAKWRKNTIRNLGVYFPGAEGVDYANTEEQTMTTSDAPKNGLLDKNGRFMKVVNG